MGWCALEPRRPENARGRIEPTLDPLEPKPAGDPLGVADAVLRAETQRQQVGSPRLPIGRDQQRPRPHAANVVARPMSDDMSQNRRLQGCVARTEGVVYLWRQLSSKGKPGTRVLAAPQASGRAVSTSSSPRRASRRHGSPFLCGTPLEAEDLIKSAMRPGGATRQNWRLAALISQ
jgi:hypothetical protein